MEILTMNNLGYISLPLAIEFVKKYKVIGFGFDINKNRIDKFKKGIVNKDILNKTINNEKLL